MSQISPDPGPQADSSERAPDEQLQRLLTTQEVAALLRVDPSSVRRWRAEEPPQGPPFIRLSERVVLYGEADVQEWLNQRRTAPGFHGKAA
ncbi:MAG: helix-turn-helix domain-containing protein [Actinomycetia bacterium]|nr:helix-turn-helix domain-containing protein [Actinomycetes bacterium]